MKASIFQKAFLKKNLFLLLLVHERYCNDSLSWETKCLSAFAGVLFASKSNSPFPEYSRHLGLYTMQMQFKINDVFVMNFRHLK